MAASWVPSEADGQKLPGISLRKTSANRRYGHVLQIFRSCGEKRQAPLPAAMIACMTVVARLVLREVSVESTPVCYSVVLRLLL